MAAKPACPEITGKALSVELVTDARLCYAVRAPQGFFKTIHLMLQLARFRVSRKFGGALGCRSFLSGLGLSTHGFSSAALSLEGALHQLHLPLLALAGIGLQLQLHMRPHLHLIFSKCLSSLLTCMLLLWRSSLWFSCSKATRLFTSSQPYM